MLKGSCCCGAVTFSLSQAPTMMATCHCSRCRKVGAATFVFVAREHVELKSGRDAIASYAPEQGYKYTRNFCSTCGSALGEMLGDEESFPIPANLFDDPLELEVRFHEFVAEKPDWLRIGDDGKQFAHHPQTG